LCFFSPEKTGNLAATHPHHFRNVKAYMLTIGRRALATAGGTMAVILLIAYAVWQATAGDGTSPASESRPNIIVYMVDTLRADELGSYGSAVTLTPFIDEFAREAELFERASVSAPSTRASIASFLTGVPPSVHGVETGLHGLFGPTAALRRLPELLQAQGYYTGALVANPNVDPVFGFKAGFDHYLGLYRQAGTPRPPSSLDLIYTAPMMVAEVRKFIEQAPVDQPFFLFVLSIDPHGPYTPPSPYDSKYDERAAGGEAGTMKNLLRIDRLLEAGRPVSMDLTRALYRGEISYADQAFGELMAWMNARGLDDDTVVVLTSDHGEAFGEHGDRGHGKTVYQETVQVPLIIRHPQHFAGSRRRNENVNLLDLSATLASIAGATPPDYWPGRDLRGPLSPRPIFSMSHPPDHAYTTTIVGDYKLIEDELGGSTRLFDLALDPLEERPLDASIHQSALTDMTQTLVRFREISAELHSMMVSGQLSLDAEEIPDSIREQLQSLGYVE